MLLSAGANPNALNCNLWAPIHMACYFNQPQAIAWIVEHNKQAATATVTTDPEV